MKIYVYLCIKIYPIGNPMKRLFTLFIILLTVFAVHAQNLSVESFRMDIKDLTANTAGTTVLDQNGEKCALIKVETTQTGFSFNTGSLGVMKTEQHVGEIWVYVPEGVKRITISHQQLGILRDYELGETVKRARTYILKLITGEVHTVVKKARTSQYVVFQLQPANAVVMLNGEMLATQDGTATKMMKFGTYDYQVQAPDYLPQMGKVTVNDPKQKHVVSVSLKPNFTSVTLTADNNAEIWVNGDKKGTGSWTGPLGAGTYEFETRLAGHRSASQTRDITVSSEPISIRLQSPTPIYGEADISSSPAMADIYIDGTKRGQTPQLIDQLLIGQHQLRLSKQGYADYSGTININEGETASVNATINKGANIAAEQHQTLNVPSEEIASLGKTFTVGNVSFNMIRVDGGTFMMGATSEQENPENDEKPAHQVTLSTFYIGETEVTQELWNAVMGKSPSHFIGGQRPVEQVSWKACHKFIEKLSKKTGLKFRLPTEAEWEFAARGGNKSQGYQYSGSNNLNDVAWFGDNSGRATHIVKTKHANELGIYDMSGNVEEWCQDWFDSYNSGSLTNPVGPESGFYRVCRGGGWDYYARGCRVSNRVSSNPDSRCDFLLGLRLALSVM